MPRRALILAACLLALAPSPAAAAAWTRPVRGRVVARFLYTRARPFAAGARRGADFAAAPGAPVSAPCAGVVTYAGAVPGWGAGVSVRCGALVATVLRLAALHVRWGEAVFAGERVGSSDAAGSVRLGARVATDRFGYVNPLALLRPAHHPPPLVPTRVPLGAGWRRGPAPRVVPFPRPPPLAAPAAPHPAVAARRAPVIAWVGAGLLAVSLSAGVGARVVVRRRRVARPAAARAP